jgi:hypothetical protein
MSEFADIAARTQRFNETARAFTPPPPTRHAKLMPMRDGIVELRQKGASLRLIRELLATVDVFVGTDTIARFLAEVNGEATPTRTPKRSGRRRASHTSLNQAQSGSAQPPPQPTPSVEPNHTAPPAERPRSRGPRVADPRNL